MLLLTWELVVVERRVAWSFDGSWPMGEHAVGA